MRKNHDSQKILSIFKFFSIMCFENQRLIFSFPSLCLRFLPRQVLFLRVMPILSTKDKVKGKSISEKEITSGFSIPVDLYVRVIGEPISKALGTLYLSTEHRIYR